MNSTTHTDRDTAFDLDIETIEDRSPQTPQELDSVRGGSVGRGVRT